MENENKFCNTFANYAMFLNSVKSISLLKKNNISNLKLRIRIIINNKFLIHSLGLNYCKTFFGKYRKDISALIKDILTKRLTEEQILLDIPKSKQKYFEKKLESIKYWPIILPILCLRTTILIFLNILRSNPKLIMTQHITIVSWL